MAKKPEPPRPVIRLAARTWSHLMPLARGSVQSPDLDVRFEGREHTPDRAQEPEIDAAETSFSGYVRDLAHGDDRWVGLPAFVMRGFRHRCFLVRQDSPLKSLSQLRGASIGVTGWPDSGNTWARSLLRRSGVGLDDVTWTIAPLHGGPLAANRIGGALPKNVHAATPGTSLLGALEDGVLDAVVAPFVPDLEHTVGRLRHLLPYVDAELAYFEETGFVPGIHLVTLRRDICERYPWVPSALLRTLQDSKEEWWRERQMYADTTPWMLEELRRTERTFGDWMPYGVTENRDMVASFCAELFAQDLLATPVNEADVFRAYANFDAQTETKETTA